MFLIFILRIQTIGLGPWAYYLLDVSYLDFRELFKTRFAWTLNYGQDHKTFEIKCTSAVEL